MRFENARDFVTTSGLGLILDPANGINGVAIGRKDGGALSGTTDYCVTAFVTKKLTQDELQHQNVRSFEYAFQNATRHRAENDADLDVVEIGRSFELQNSFVVPSPQRGLYGGNPPALNAQKSFTSLRCGIGITNPVGRYPTGLSVGTAGFYMRDDNGKTYVVSNNHVIGGSNSASPGDIVIQPGSLDLTTIELALMPNLAALTPIQIGRLTSFVPLNFITPTAAPFNLVDAAIAEVDATARSIDDIDRLTFGGCILGVAQPYDVDNTGALLGSDRVYKVGRTTGYTEGIVTNVATIVPVPYPGGTAVFSNQIAVQPTGDNVGLFSDGGDSGSGVLNDRHELVGLLFAGSPRRTLLNPIGEVISELSNVTGIPTLEVVHV